MVTFYVLKNLDTSSSCGHFVPLCLCAFYQLMVPAEPTDSDLALRIMFSLIK